MADRARPRRHGSGSVPPRSAPRRRLDRRLPHRIPASIRCSRRCSRATSPSALPVARPRTGRAVRRDLRRLRADRAARHHALEPSRASSPTSRSPAARPGVLAEFLSAALNVQAMLWRTSPAATELEEVALGWLRRLMGLPDAFEGVIYDTASISTLHALAAAREAAVPSVRAARARRAEPTCRGCASIAPIRRTRRSTRR